MKGYRRRAKGGPKGVEGGSKGGPKGVERGTEPAPFRDDAVYTAAQVAAVLQVHRDTMTAIIARGEIGARKVGQEWRVLGSEIRRFMTAARFVAPVQDPEDAP
jgi:excisionase family DNA binding protein